MSNPKGNKRYTLSVDVEPFIPQQYWDQPFVPVEPCFAPGSGIYGQPHYMNSYADQNYAPFQMSPAPYHVYPVQGNMHSYAPDMRPVCLPYKDDYMKSNAAPQHVRYPRSKPNKEYGNAQSNSSFSRYEPRGGPRKVNSTSYPRSEGDGHAVYNDPSESMSKAVERRGSSFMFAQQSQFCEVPVCYDNNKGFRNQSSLRENYVSNDGKKRNRSGYQKGNKNRNRKGEEGTQSAAQIGSSFHMSKSKLRTSWPDLLSSVSDRNEDNRSKHAESSVSFADVLKSNASSEDKLGSSDPNKGGVEGAARSNSHKSKEKYVDYKSLRSSSRQKRDKQGHKKDLSVGRNNAETEARSGGVHSRTNEGRVCRNTNERSNTNSEKLQEQKVKIVHSKEKFVPSLVQSKERLVPSSVLSKERLVPSSVQSKERLVSSSVQSKEKLVPSSVEQRPVNKRSASKVPEAKVTKDTQIDTSCSAADNEVSLVQSSSSEGQTKEPCDESEAQNKKLAEKKNRKEMKRKLQDERRKEREQLQLMKILAPKGDKIKVIGKDVLEKLAKYVSPAQNRSASNVPAEGLLNNLEEFPSLGEKKPMLSPKKSQRFLTHEEACAGSDSEWENIEGDEVQPNVALPVNISHLRTLLKTASKENKKTEASAGNEQESVMVKRKPRRKDPIQIDIFKALQNKQTKSQKKREREIVTGSKIKKHELEGRYCGNILYSSNPERKRGKKREVPKKKVTPLKGIILQERARKKAQRQVQFLVHWANSLNVKPEEETENDENKVPNELKKIEEVALVEENASDGSDIESKAKALIHTRKFRDYCEHLLTPDLQESVRVLVSDIVRFQDRQYERNPVKAHARRRYVVGLREARKYLVFKRLKLIILASDLERVEAKGGLDDVIREIKKAATAYEIPYLFFFGRRNLGRLCMKVVPVSCVGILNYEGTKDNFDKVMKSLEEAKEKYRDTISKIMQEISGTTSKIQVENNMNSVEEEKPEIDMKTQLINSFLSKLEEVVITPRNQCDEIPENKSSVFLDAIERPLSQVSSES